MFLRSDPSTTGVVTKLRNDACEVMWGGATTRFSWVPLDSLVLRPRGEAEVVNGDDFIAFLALQKLANHRFADVLYAIGTSRTQFLVYQYQPVLKFVREAPHGLLIADEVGLGKTIEAALILREMQARAPLERVLVVCPANLREKWRSELQQRFAVTLRELRASDFREFRTQFDQTGRWPSFFGVASLEGLRGGDFAAALQEAGVSMDLVIIDEAHHLRNPTTRSFELGETLSEYADQIVLLSATPVQNSSEDLRSLLRLIAPTEFSAASQGELESRLLPNRYINAALRELSSRIPDLTRVADQLDLVLTTPLATEFRGNSIFKSSMELVKGSVALSTAALVRLRADLQSLHTLSPYYVRTRKREVQEGTERIAQTKTVALTPEESEFYDAWYDYLVAVANADHPGSPANWAVIQRERQAASCIPNAVALVPELIAARAPQDVETNDPDAVGDDTGPSNSASAEVLQAAARLKTAADSVNYDSKFDDFVEIIEGLVEAEPLRKILVFTFFRGTLAYLKRQLEQRNVRVYTMSGENQPRERAQIIEDFRADARSRVILSTEVGSEGLDLQFCDAVVNYDLPWNPMRVEQRIGRIDRYGQRADKVAVVSLYVDDTIDTRILSRLYERIGVFESSIGELEPILGPEVRELQAAAFTRGLAPDQIQRRIDERLQRIEEETRRQQEFESQRAELMGTGELDRAEIDATLKSGRYVSARENHALVASWLATFGRHSRLESARQDGVLQLYLGEEAIASVRAWMGRQTVRQRADECMAFLDGIAQGTRRFATFDSTVAQNIPTLAFIDAQHPLIQTALHDLGRSWDPDATRHVGVFKQPNEIATPHWLVLYRVGVHGVESADRLLPVAVNPDMEGSLEVGEQLMGLLPTAQAANRNEATFVESPETVDRAAQIVAGKYRSELERDLIRSHADRVSARKASLQRQYTTRIGQRRATLEKLVTRGRSPQVIRMKEREVQNLEAERDAKLKELDQLPAPSTDLEPIAYAHFGN